LDEIVVRSMLKWPDVPAVYGWLALDRRGNWLIKSAPKGDMGDLGAGFERIGNSAVSEFIGRNYARDRGGRYYFQNGPQRVYVALDYTPFVFRLDDASSGFAAHTGAAAGRIKRAFFDEEGSLVLSAALGVGVVLDRDLAATLEHFTDRAGQPLEADMLYSRVQGGERLVAHLMGLKVAVSHVRAKAAPSRFGFVARPEPPPGHVEQ
jgi:hypothetical protein